MCEYLLLGFSLFLGGFFCGGGCCAAVVSVSLWGCSVFLVSVVVVAVGQFSPVSGCCVWASTLCWVVV